MAGRPGWRHALYRAAAGPAGSLYAAAARRRNRRYDRRGGADLGRPAVAVGNVTAGGTGKTPVVRLVAGWLCDAGRRPAVLTRGYRGGDEAQELRDAFAADGLDVPVIVDADRVAGARSAPPAVDCFVLDDGFQHRRAGRTLDLVLIDATDPLGHGRCLPAGLLREPAAGLARAGAVLLTRCDQVPPAALSAVRSVAAGLTTAPLFTSRHVIGELLDAGGRPHEPREYAAFCGLGNPDGFFDALTARLPEARRVAAVVFADHHRYTRADLAAVRRAAGKAPLVTSGKDWVKLPDRGGVLRAALRVEVEAGGGLRRRVLDAVGGA